MSLRRHPLSLVAIAVIATSTVLGWTTPEESLGDTAPSWILNPSSFFKSSPDGIALVVGTTTLEGDPAFSHALGAAEADARSKINSEDPLERLWLWESNDRNLFVLFALAPAGKDLSLPPMKSGALEEPSWVQRPRSYFKEPREDLLIAVGLADKSPSSTMSERMARADAMNKLALSIAGTLEEISDDNGVVSRTETNTKIVGAEVLATWVSPKGTTYVLMSAPKAQMKKK